jgi:hypothetical protein
MTKFGFSGLSNSLNSQINRNFTTLNALKLNNLLLPVRVKSIVLNELHPRFIELGEWNGLGAIEYEPVATPTPNTNLFSVAFPLNSNTKNFPLINEIVYLIILPNTALNSNQNASTTYYANIVNLWNHPHHNAFPTNPTNLPSPQSKDYAQTSLGSVRRVTDQSTEIELGKTFKERSNLHPLLPFEGDVIHEGRWGNSIRLGSTVKTAPNNWSRNGEDGDPLTIIRNGQGSQTDQGWIPIVENINNDNSSIYLASTQNIPIVVSSTREYKSYANGQQPTSPNQYAGNQIVLNSGRLVFNSTNDHILLSSAKSINLNSGESVNIDTKKFITQADKIFLGNEEQAKEPLLLGDTTVNLLRDLIDALKSLSTTLKTATTSPAVLNQPLTIPSLQLASISLSTKLTLLDQQLNTITSKRNFTA